MMRFKLILPFILIILLIIPYSILDTYVLVDIFGHDPYSSFNANDLRKWVFGFLGFISIIIGGFNSIHLLTMNRTYKYGIVIAYNLFIIILNTLAWFYVNMMFAWK